MPRNSAILMELLQLAMHPATLRGVGLKAAVPKFHNNGLNLRSQTSRVVRKFRNFAKLSFESQLLQLWHACRDAEQFFETRKSMRKVNLVTRQHSPHRSHCVEGSVSGGQILARTRRGCACVALPNILSSPQNQAWHLHARMAEIELGICNLKISMKLPWPIGEVQVLKPGWCR
eukprot:1900854-Amphidinium_carterae.1